MDTCCDDPSCPRNVLQNTIAELMEHFGEDTGVLLVLIELMALTDGRFRVADESIENLIKEAPDDFKNLVREKVAMFAVQAEREAAILH